MRRVHNAYLLHAALTILPNCDSGKALDKVASYPKLHARTIHLLMILDPFIPDGIGSSSGSGSGGSSANSGGGKVAGGVGVEELRRIDIARRERHKQTTNNNNNNSTTTNRQSSANNLSPKAVQIAEPSIRHKEDTQYILPNILYFNYSIADAHLRLLIALVSCNSTYGPPVVRTLWTLLTDFGSRWKEYMVSYNNKLGHDEDRVVLLESDRPVPGMAGLSVEFIRDVLSLCNGSSSSSSSHGVIHKRNDSSNDMTTETMTITNTNTNDYNYDNNDNYEEIYSDRLPHGRVYRLLLAINNIFRICPQSKVDLLREMSTNFPHYKFCPRPRYIWYIHTCMQLVHLATTSYEGPVLALFMDRALDMDVEIKITDAGAVALSNTTATTDDGGDNVNNDLVTTTTTTTADSRKRSYEQMTDNTNNVAIPSSSNDGGTSSTSTTTISTNAIVEGSKDVDEDLLEISERLDTLMSTIYGHIILITTYQSNSLTSAMSAVVRVRKLYRLHLEGVFERKVRTTDRTKFVQFIFLVLFGRENDALVEVGRLLAMRREEEQQILHQNKMEDTIEEDSELIAGGMITTTMPSSSDEPLYRGFIAKLIDYFYNPNYAGDAPRRTVVCYLASFVSRATYVCPETVCECLAALLRWAEVYIAAKLSEVMPKKLNRLSVSSSSSSSRLSLGGGNIQHPCEMHALFYTCCQAAFYIFCFRGAEALTYYHRACQHQDDPEAGYADPQSVDIGPERWKFLCGHSLQPLKYCLESVRSEFLTLAQDLNLFYNDVGDDDHEGGEGGINRRDEATKFIEQLHTSTSLSSSSLHQEKLKQTPSSPFPKKLKLSGTPKSRRSTIISTAATQEKKRLDGGVGGLGRGSNPLDSFFPFDPYLLKHSHEYVCPYFRNWQDCILTIDEEEEEYFVDSNYDDIPVEESVVNEEDSNSEAESDDDNDDNDDERIDDVESEISDIDDEDEEIVIINEKEIGDDEFDKERDEEQRECSLPNNTLQKSLSSDNHLELEIRRSRAMSTGSQCSW
jgi:RNA polymerase I-specific transcription initiation factor RRN3